MSKDLFSHRHMVSIGGFAWCRGLGLFHWYELFTESDSASVVQLVMTSSIMRVVMGSSLD